MRYLQLNSLHKCVWLDKTQQRICYVSCDGSCWGNWGYWTTDCSALLKEFFFFMCLGHSTEIFFWPAVDTPYTRWWFCLLPCHFAFTINPIWLMVHLSQTHWISFQSVWMCKTGIRFVPLLWTGRATPSDRDTRLNCGFSSELIMPENPPETLSFDRFRWDRYCHCLHSQLL